MDADETGEKSALDKETRRQGDKEQASSDQLISLSPNLRVSRSEWQDRGEIPDLGSFYGRAAELMTLRRWLVAERCRVVTILGIGGVDRAGRQARRSSSRRLRPCDLALAAQRPAAGGAAARLHPSALGPG
jgi:hypothetical protein